MIYLKESELQSLRPHSLNYTMSLLMIFLKSFKFWFNRNMKNIQINIRSVLVIFSDITAFCIKKKNVFYSVLTPSSTFISHIMYLFYYRNRNESHPKDDQVYENKLAVRHEKMF